MRLISILVFFLFLLSCEKEETTFNPPMVNTPPVIDTILPPPSSIQYLALGDSYTIGQSVPVQSRYPIQLATRLQADSIEMDTTIIIAQTGWTTTNLKNAINNANLTDTFELVSLLIGVNNQYQNKPIEQYKIEFAELLQSAIDFVGGEKENVFVLSIPDYAYTPFGNGSISISQEIDDFNLVNKIITDSVGVSYFDITPISREGLDKPNLVANDNLHPSGLQYQRWVDLIYEEVRMKVED